MECDYYIETKIIIKLLDGIESYEIHVVLERDPNWVMKNSLLSNVDDIYNFYKQQIDSVELQESEILYCDNEWTSQLLQDRYSVLVDKELENDDIIDTIIKCQSISNNI